MHLTLLQKGKKLRHSGMLLLMFLIATSAMAQSNVTGVTQRITSGRITAEDKSPLPGVNVVIKGTSNGTVTDAEGNYQIIATSANDVVIFSFVGFASKEVRVGELTTLDVVLTPDTKQLNEVVVTALGIEKDAGKIGYAVQKVQGSDLTKAREPNAVNSLAGKVAGLTVGSSTEMMGRPNVVLRGNSDILFVVDGVPISTDTWNISSDDIENYTVLKGPNASALYGSRGQNGAILITTKKASRERPFTIEFNSSTMFDKGFLTNLQTQDEYGPGDNYQYAYGNDPLGKTGINSGDYDIWGPRFNFSDGPTRSVPQYDSPIDPATGIRQGTPWVNRGKNNLNRFVQTGILSTNNISISSRTDKADLRFSISQNSQRGIIPNTNLNITNVNMSQGFNFSSKVRLEATINYNHQSSPNTPDVQYGPNSLIYNIAIWGGADWNIDDMKSYWEDGKVGVQQKYAEHVKYNNPYFVAHEWLRGHNKNDLYGQVKLSFKINDHFDVSVRTQISTWDQFKSEKMPYSAISYDRYVAQGDYREDKRNLFENNTDALVKYTQNFGKFSVNAIGGANLRTFSYNSFYGTTDYLSVPGVYNFSNSKNSARFFNYNSNMQVGSAYYTLDLGYRNYFNISTTGRVDKLSTLPSSNNTYFYPSVSISTVVNEYVKLPEVITFLKLRASYANVKDGLTQYTIGPAFAALGIQTLPMVGYGAFNTTNQNGSYQVSSSAYDGPSYGNGSYYSTNNLYNNQPSTSYTNVISNPKLKPSSTSSFEYGLDAKFLENRIGFGATLFDNINGPKIFNLPVSESTGYSSAIQNGIKTQKQGIELTLSGTPLRNPTGLTWDVLVNWSTFKETLKEIYPADPTITNYNTYLKVGDRMDKWYGNKFYRSPDGSIITKSGLPMQDNGTPQFLGYTNPDWVFGINNKFTYKNFTFSFQFDGRVGGVILDYNELKLMQGGRHIWTTQGDMGVARKLEDADVFANNSTSGHYVGNGEEIVGGTPNIVNGVITNMNELTFAKNTTPVNLQNWVGGTRNFDEADRISRSFVKLREIILGYNLPKSALAKTPIRQASFSIVARNVFYWGAVKDYDIDPFSSGYNFSNNRTVTAGTLQTPTMRRYGFNINLVF